MSERDRQAMLLQLRRETRRTEQEETLETAARLLGLLEREGAEAADRMRSDRARHEELARRRLAAHRLGKAKEACAGILASLYFFRYGFILLIIFSVIHMQHSS